MRVFSTGPEELVCLQAPTRGVGAMGGITGGASSFFDLGASMPLGHPHVCLLY